MKVLLETVTTSYNLYTNNSPSVAVHSKILEFNSSEEVSRFIRNLEPCEVKTYDASKYRTVINRTAITIN